MHGSLVVLALMTFAGEAEAGEQALAPFRAAGGAHRRHAAGHAVPARCTCRRTRTITRSPSAARCSSTVSTTRSRRRSWNTSRRPMPRCGSRSSGSSAALSLASRPTRPRSRTAAARSWSTSPPSSTAGPADAGQAWVEAFHEALQQDDDGAYVELPRDEGAERVRDAYPGPTWDRLARSRPVRPDEPVPPEPEHPAEGPGVNDVLAGRRHDRVRSVGRRSRGRVRGWCATTAAAMSPLAALLSARCDVFVYDRRGRGSSGDIEPYAVSVRWRTSRPCSRSPAAGRACTGIPPAPSSRSRPHPGASRSTGSRSTNRPSSWTTAAPRSRRTTWHGSPTS